MLPKMQNKQLKKLHSVALNKENMFYLSTYTPQKHPNITLLVIFQCHCVIICVINK